MPMNTPKKMSLWTSLLEGRKEKCWEGKEKERGMGWIKKNDAGWEYFKLLTKIFSN